MEQDHEHNHNKCDPRCGGWTGGTGSGAMEIVRTAFELNECVLEG